MSQEIIDQYLRDGDPKYHVWDRRPSSLSRCDCVYPPVQSMVLSPTNERISGVFHVNFDTGLVGRYRMRMLPDGREVVYCNVATDGTKTPIEEWITIKGVKVVPLPPTLVKEQVKKNLAAKGYHQEDDGTITVGHKVQ